MDKTKALEAALGQIERQFGKGSIMRLGNEGKVVEVQAIPTGSLGLDLALGGIGTWRILSAPAVPYLKGE